MAAWLAMSSGSSAGNEWWICCQPTFLCQKEKWGGHFLATLAQEFQGVKARTWNSKQPLVFVTVILQTTLGVRRARDIHRCLAQWMDLWHRGHFT
jgi:hypothetical protein